MRLLGEWQLVEFHGGRTVADQNLQDGFVRFDTFRGSSVSLFRRGGCTELGGYVTVDERTLLVSRTGEYEKAAIDCPQTGEVPALALLGVALQSGTEYTLVDGRRMEISLGNSERLVLARLP